MSGLGLFADVILIILCVVVGCSFIEYVAKILNEDSTDDTRK